MTQAEEKIILLLEQILERLSAPEPRRVSNTEPFESKAWAQGKLIELHKRREKRNKRGHGSETSRD